MSKRHRRRPNHPHGVAWTQHTTATPLAVMAGLRPLAAGYYSIPLDEWAAQVNERRFPALDAPRLATPGEQALARIAALEAETARLRAGLADLRAFTHPIGHYNCARSGGCSCGAAMFNDRGNDMRERIDALLAAIPS